MVTDPAIERAREIDRRRLARLDAAAKVQIGLAAATGVHAALSFGGWL